MRSWGRTRTFLKMALLRFPFSELNMIFVTMLNITLILNNIKLAYFARIICLLSFCVPSCFKQISKTQERMIY